MVREANLVNAAELSRHEKNYMKWHVRLGHLSSAKMRLMAKQCKGAESLAAIPPAVFDSARPCSHCLMSKMRKKSLKMSSASQRSDKRVVMDVWGAFKVPSAEYKYQHLVGFTHETTGFTAVYPTVDHTADTLVNITRRYTGDMAKHENFDMRILRTGNGAEMCSEKYQAYLADSLISWERIVRRTSTSKWACRRGDGGFSSRAPRPC